jgi:hypothetical protein
VTRNLATALRRVRLWKEPVSFWVDAICIDQDDNAEKSRQLALMPDIYSKAFGTVIWLGPRTDRSHEAMEFIRSASKLEVDDANINIDSLVPAKALTALYKRTWWQRVWVLRRSRRLSSAGETQRTSATSKPW